ncbi:MAG TPA: gfo/Idh/MocA family oxidoreductase, partial [Planctomycetaceae bacterium]|nr:gfo/Idh/MocA family oxidoreductase [Planctomycetaceae bacterium]
MGWIHYLAYQQCEEVELAAFCSRDSKKRAGDWTGIHGNFGPPGEQIDVSELAAYESLDALLADDSIDLVDICLPPNLHVDAACKALAAGKHVLCEKPLGLTTEDCDQILEAAAKHDRLVMVAQVLPFMGEFQYAYDQTQAGQLGTPRRAYFKRVISPPDWIPDFFNPKTVGGPLIDLHVHDVHFVRLLFGLPKRVLAIAEMQDGVVRFCHTLMEFEDPDVIVSTSSGVSEQTARPFCHGFEIQFQSAAMQFELSALTDGAAVLPLHVLGQDGHHHTPELAGDGEIAAFASEISAAANSIV